MTGCLRSFTKSTDLTDASTSSDDSGPSRIGYSSVNPLSIASAKAVAWLTAPFGQPVVYSPHRLAHEPTKCTFGLTLRARMMSSRIFFTSVMTLDTGEVLCGGEGPELELAGAGPSMRACRIEVFDQRLTMTVRSRGESAR